MDHDHTTDGRPIWYWVAYQGVHSHLDLLSWNPEELKTDHSEIIYDVNDEGATLHLRTNQVKQITGPLTYMRHVFESHNSGPVIPEDPVQPFSPNNWNTHTSLHMRTYLVNNTPSPLWPNPIRSGPISSSRTTEFSSVALELMGYRKSIKREIAAHPTLKNETYFDSFNRSLFIVSKSHECSEILDSTYTPGSAPEQKGLFEAKQTFMFSVFNANLLTDQGKTIVRKHLATTDGQTVW